MAAVLLLFFNSPLAVELPLSPLLQMVQMSLYMLLLETVDMQPKPNRNPCLHGEMTQTKVLLLVLSESKHIFSCLRGKKKKKKRHEKENMLLLVLKSGFLSATVFFSCTLE